MQKIEKIYKDYYEIVYKYLLCLTHDKDIAEELSQETFYKMIKNIDKFEGKSKLSSWLFEIAKNLWYDEVRKKKRNIFVSNEECDIESNENIEEKYIEKEESKKVLDRIESLDKLTQRVIYLRLNFDLSFKEIGTILGKSEVWARVTFYRGKQKVKEEMDNE